MISIVMTGTGVYVPRNKVYNEEIDEHFESMGLNAHSLMEHLGRRKRYFISEGENAITMCQNAIDDCIKKNNIDPQTVDMLIICTDTPEYLFPSNALKIVGMYGDKLKNVRVSFDLNCNCAGMVVGMNVASKYMMSSDINRALVIGCFCVSPIALWNDTVVYANLADAAACVMLEKEESDVKRGFIDEESYIDGTYQKYITFPKCGMSQVPLQSVYPNEKRLEWIPFSTDFLSERWAQIIEHLLERNQMLSNEIDHYVFSQLSDNANVGTLKKLGVFPDGGKYHFLGKEYAYTGNTCPVLCLDRMWNMYSQRGHKLIFCTVGAGYTALATLYQF